MKTPSENFECKTFARWLSRQTALLFSKIPVGDSTLSGKEGKLLTSLGVRRGIPDFAIVHRGTGRVFFVEMKRARGGRLSREQELWLTALDKCGCVAYGNKDAQRHVTEYYKKDGLKL